MSEVVIQQLKWKSSLHQESIDLRYRVLREPLGLHFTEEQLEAEFDQIHLGAIQDQKVVGILLLQQISPEIWKMRQVAVDFSVQNLGIGKQLVLFSEDFLKEQHAKTIELHARETAIPFYLSLGYSIKSGIFEEVGIPHKKMQKKIASPY